MKWLVSAVFVLLVSASSVRASCGWVLWLHSVDSQNEIAADYEPLEGYDSKTDCQKSQQAWETRFKTVEQPRFKASFTCFPSDFDPRRKSAAGH